MRYNNKVKIIVEKGRKLEMLKKTSQWLARRCEGTYERRLCYDIVGKPTEVSGFEIAFEKNTDAMMFKLSWTYDDRSEEENV